MDPCVWAFPFNGGCGLDHVFCRVRPPSLSMDPLFQLLSCKTDLNKAIHYHPFSLILLLSPLILSSKRLWSSLYGKGSRLAVVDSKFPTYNMLMIQSFFAHPRSNIWPTSKELLLYSNSLLVFKSTFTKSPLLT